MSAPQFRPVVAPESDMREFTFRALILGLFMSVILGAANAYLGLEAGMTIAATYPAAVIGMAVLRAVQGLDPRREHRANRGLDRRIGRRRRDLHDPGLRHRPACGTFDGLEADYLKSTALMVVGGVLGILFVTLLRRVMVEDPELPFPESVAAAEIHKAGQRGAAAAKQLFEAMGVGGADLPPRRAQAVFARRTTSSSRSARSAGAIVRLGFKRDAYTIAAGGASTMSAPAVSPAYLGVGYIIGPQLAALNFAGGLLAWGLFVPLLVYFLGPNLIDSFAASIGSDPAAEATWVALADHIWQVHRPADRGRRHAGRRRLHPLPDAQEPVARHPARRRRPEASRPAAHEATEPDRPRHRASRSCSSASPWSSSLMCRALLLLHRRDRRRGDGRAGDARDRASSSPPCPATWSA